MSLTEKQRRFVEAYMGEAAGNATEAARLAGYAGNDVTLASVGSENLRKPQVRAAIDERVEADPAVASRMDRQRWWSRVMRGEDETMLDERIRMKASELLAKAQGDFIDRSEVTHRGDGIPVQIVDTYEAALEAAKGGENAGE